MEYFQKPGAEAAGSHTNGNVFLHENFPDKAQKPLPHVRKFDATQ